MIEEFSSAEELEILHDDWRRLLARTPAATFFQSLAWLKVYWKHFGADQKLKVLVVRDGSEVTGIVPLVIRKEKSRLGNLSYLTYPLDYWGSYFGPIGADPGSILGEGLKYLAKQCRGWDLIDLRWLGGQEDDCDRTEGLLRGMGETPIKRLLDQTAIIEMPATWDEYLASRTSKWRNSLKRSQRKAAMLGEVTVEKYRPEGGADTDPRFDLLDQCVRIAESSWQNSSSDGTTLSSKSVHAFLREAHTAAAAEGCLDLNVMRIDGKPVAFGYNYYYQSRLFGLRMGYDPAVRSCGVGNLLYARMIQRSCELGDTIFDIGPGSLAGKRQLWTSVKPIYRLTCYRRYSLSQQLMRMKHEREARHEAADVVTTRS